VRLEGDSGLEQEEEPEAAEVLAESEVFLRFLGRFFAADMLHLALR
jgi:hypothetical protein